MWFGKKIKIEVSEQDAATLDFMQNKCRSLYNWWVMRLRNGEKWPGWAPAKLTLQQSKEHDPELQYVYAKLLHEVYFKLDHAMKAFFRRCKSGEKPGFPRVRPRHSFFTLTYPAMYIKADGRRLILPTGGGRRGVPKHFPNIVAHLTEDAPDNFGAIYITRDAKGAFYATFTVDRPVAPPTLGGVVAFDLGIKTLATGINQQGRVYHIGGFKGCQWYNRQIDKITSKRSCCQKGSRRFKRLSQVKQKISERKRNKQRDCLHKASHLIAHRLVERTVVIGDLSQTQMVIKTHKERRRNLNRSVFNDWGLYGFVQMLEYKCLHVGKELEKVNERYTSKECSRCKKRQDMPLWNRTYRCGNCGLVMDRDENSAINILQRFLARLGPHTSTG